MIFRFNISKTNFEYHISPLNKMPQKNIASKDEDKQFRNVYIDSRQKILIIKPKYLLHEKGEESTQSTPFERIK